MWTRGTCLSVGLVGVLAAAGCSATPASSGSSSGPGTGASGPVASQPRAVSPTPASMFWPAERVSLTTGGFTSPVAIAHGDLGTIIVGSGPGPRAPGNLVAWRDGGAGGWQAVASPAFEAGVPNAATAWRGGFVAVGRGTVDVTDGSRGFAGSGPNAIVWTSADGAAWSRYELGASPADRAFLWSDVYDVIAFHGRLVAVGYAEEPASRTTCQGGGTGLVWVPRMWTSTDGRAWTPIEDPDLRCGRLLALVAGGPGLVAVGDRQVELMSGSRSTGRTADVGQIWTSVDGLDWSPASAPSDLEWLWSVAGGPAGLVAVAGYREPVVSRDGLTWQRAPLGDPAGAGLFGLMVNRVLADEHGYLAVGGIKVDAGYRAAAWSSPDGRAWTRILGADSEPATLQLPLADAYLTPTGFVAVGGGTTAPGVWMVTRPS